ncbi:MAG: ArsA family ATPase [Candidatus Methanosuratincola sp.]
MNLQTFFSRRLILVTGKGGVGKTTVSLALAFLNARHKRRSIVAMSDRFKGFSSAFGKRKKGMQSETRLNRDVYAIVIEPNTALDEYIKERFGRAIPLYSTLFKLGLIRRFFEAAPGLKELITMGKVWQLGRLLRPRGRGAPKYEQVIFDAPSTGHALPLFQVPQKVLELVRSGPFREHVAWVEEMLKNPHTTALVTVATPEEMAVEENQEIIEGARSLGIEHAFCVVNRVYPERFSECDGRLIDELLMDERFGGVVHCLRAAKSYIKKQELSRKYVAALMDATGGRLFRVRERFTGELSAGDLVDISRELEEQFGDGDGDG